MRRSLADAPAAALKGGGESEFFPVQSGLLCGCAPRVHAGGGAATIHAACLGAAFGAGRLGAATGAGSPAACGAWLDAVVSQRKNATRSSIAAASSASVLAVAAFSSTSAEFCWVTSSIWV